jgi:hypothetical protein
MIARTIIVSGAIANKAGHGGEAWVRLNWALGFRKLGFRVVLLEQLGGVPEAGQLGYFSHVVERFGFEDACALIGEGGETLYGMERRQIETHVTDAEALINISGHLTYGPVMERVRRRVYVDIDPGFTQFWHAAGNRGARLEGHDFHFTIGENIGTPECPIPTSGIAWRKTRPPIVLQEWPVASGLFERFTTIGSWRGPFGVVEFGGQSFGLKAHEFRKFIELPQRASVPFEIALNIHPADGRDLEALQRHGWRITDPSIARGPDDFRAYVQGSSAEFSVAQGIYVQTASGWFSDRTAAYLATGKPALVQNTGFSRNLPTGEGLLAFRTLEEAVAGAESIAAEYPRHCRAARAIAEEYFDSGTVLRKVLQQIDLALPHAS